MPLPIPSRIQYGEKLNAVDCYAELYFYPGGHFLMNFAIRANSSTIPASVNVGFALFDAAGKPLGGKTFGMEENQSCNIEPLTRGFPPERHDTIAWNMPPGLVAQAERVAICFRPQGTAPDWHALAKRAKAPLALAGDG